MNYEYLISGGLFYGCGGGGNCAAARELFRRAAALGREPEIVPLSGCSDEAFYITAFGVGNTACAGVRDPCIDRIRAYLVPILGGPVGGVIPVEIGPKSLAQAWYLATALEVPLLDADIVGGRASPELFLESITLHNISRMPLLLMNVHGDVLLYRESAGYRAEEQILRALSAASGGQIAAVGYSIRGRQAKQYLEAETVSRCERAGALLAAGRSEALLRELGAEILFTGCLSDIRTEPCQGFLEQYLFLQNGADVCKVYVKNESLVVWINDKPRAACPSLLVMLDESGQPRANGTLNVGEHIRLVRIPPCPTWRTADGSALFSPRQFGFDFDPL